MRAGVETRPYNVILRLQTEESLSDCKIFAEDIHECPADKSKVLRFNQGFPRNVTHPNVSICEERTHKGVQGVSPWSRDQTACIFTPTSRLAGDPVFVWAFCFSDAEWRRAYLITWGSPQNSFYGVNRIKKSSKTFHALRVAGKLMD